MPQPFTQDLLIEVRDALVGNFGYKAVEYANTADYQTGLATEAAAGWVPHLITNRAGGVSETLVVTYRRTL